MKKINNAHRWTNDELKRLMCMWLAGDEVDAIASAFGITRHGVHKQVTRMRADGIPLPRRKNGVKADRASQPWTQSEIEYLVRRRQEGATSEQIGNDLGRTFLAVQGMVRVLINEGVAVPMLGGGRKRLWSAEGLKSAIVGRNVIRLEKAA